jgi:hypothetical protein
MTSTGSVPNVQEILLTFATEGEPTPKRLEAFSKEYPEYRRELTSLAVDLVLDLSRQAQPADASTARIVSSAWKRFQAGTAGRTTASQSSGGVHDLPDVFEAFTGPLFPKLAARVGVTPVFLLKVRDSLIEAAGFPRALSKLIADEVGHGADIVQALLERPASMPEGTMAKANGKPEVGKKQTFQEAVQSSGLSEEQRKRLLAMAEAEIGSD